MKKTLTALLLAVMCIIMAFSMSACTSYDYRIGVQAGTTGKDYVQGNEDMELNGFRNIECMSYENGGLAVKAMTDGQIDYVIIDNGPAKQLCDTNPDIKMIDIALTQEQYAFGVDKAQEKLRTSVNKIIADMKNDGRLSELFTKYNSLTYDDKGNVTGGDEAIVGIESATIDKDKDATQLVVATNAAFAPYEYKKGDKFVGIDIEIAKIIAEKLKLELVIQDMDFDGVVVSVGKNGVDIAMAGLSVTKTRKESVNFSDSYFEGAYQVLVVKKTETKFDNCKTKADIEALLKTK